jgi:hypothetical protein
VREVAVALLVLLVVTFAGSAPSRLIEHDRVRRGGGPCSSGSGEPFGDVYGRESLDEALEEAQTGMRRAPPLPCDAAQVDIGRACHCTVKGQHARPWGNIAGVSLELPKKLEVTPGGSVSVPFSLRNRTKKTLELDFPGGEVITESEILRGKKRIEGPACGLLTVVPDAVRLTLRPGAVVRGALSWRAMNGQLTGCADTPTELAPGRYRVTFETVSGTPPLRATVNVKVRARPR